MKKPVPELHPDTPVIVEWYTYRFIPRTRHAIVVPYSKALEWYDKGVPMTCHTVDTDLYEEGFFNQRIKPG